MGMDVPCVWVGVCLGRLIDACVGEDLPGLVTCCLARLVGGRFQAVLCNEAMSSIRILFFECSFQAVLRVGCFL